MAGVSGQPRRGPSPAAAAVAMWCLAVPLGLLAEAGSYGRQPPVAWLFDLAAGWACLGFAGLVLWRGRSSGTGRLLAATGAAWFLPDLMLAGPDWLARWTAYAVLLHRGPLSHALLTYPGWRPSRRLVPVVLAGYASALAYPVWQHPAPTVVLAGLLIAAAAYRYRSSVGVARVAQGRALVATLVFAGVVVGDQLVRLLAPTTRGSLLVVPYDIAVALVAALLAIGLVTVRIEAEFSDLVIELGERRAGSLRIQLARALGDPRLEVGYWQASTGGYVDAEGRPLRLPAAGGDRRVTAIERDAAPALVLIHDPAILGDPRLVQAVSTATRLWSQHTRLEEELRGQLAEITASRERLVRAGDDERARLEDDLRRGATHRLREVEAELHAAGALAGPSSATPDAVDRAERQVRRVLDDLERLALGIHPRAISEGGLPTALRELVGASPVEVEVALRGPVAELPAEIAVCVYYLCAEGLTNAVKHGRAVRADLLVQVETGWVRVEVSDDGVGGASMQAGSGLRGLVDRVEAFGGTLDIVSPPGSGTRLSARLPVG